MGSLLIAAAAAGGTGIALLGGWKKALKPRVQKKLAALVVAKAPAALAGSKCELESVDFNISSHTSVTLKNFTIHNLDPYKSDHLVSIGSVSVVVDAKGAAKSAIKAKGKPTAIRIVSIDVSGFHIILEKDGVTTSNIKALLDKLEAEDAASTEAPPPAADGKQKAAPQLEIGGLKVMLMKVEATTPWHEYRGVPKVKMTLPDLHFKDFTKQVNETKPNRVIRKLVTTILESITESTKELGCTVIGAVTNVAELGTEAVVQAGNSAVTSIGSAAGSMFEAVADGASSLFGFTSSSTESK